MALLKVANIHFNLIGSSRLESIDGLSINLVANTNGIKITSNSIMPFQSNTITIGDFSRSMGDLYIEENSKIDLGNNVSIKRTSANLEITGAGNNYTFDGKIYGSGGDAGSILKGYTKQKLTSNGTYSVPYGCRMIRVTACGGGGGGGAAKGGTYWAFGGGGNSGTTSVKWIDVSNWSNTTTYIIGDGGAAGTTSDTFAPDGKATSFGAHLTCPGGTGGQYMGNSGTSATIYRHGYGTGLYATGGHINSQECPGTFAVKTTSNDGSGGAGGKTIFSGTAMSRASACTGVSGVSGGGGGGAIAQASDMNGGAGGKGFILVEEFY